MLAAQPFIWWYATGWMALVRSIRNVLISIGHAFSTTILLRTLFAPWRRIVTYPGASLEAKTRALADNLVSRAVGFMLRFIMLLTASLMMLVVLIIGVMCAVLWPLVPLAIVILLIKGALG